jgi:mannose-1-phosphate guanylyltransferase
MVNFVILCGGSGSRLWPKSREKLPKQLLKLTNNYTMLQNTLLRINHLANAIDKDNIVKNKIFVICNTDHTHIVDTQMNELKLLINYTIISEPKGRDSAPAICISALLGDLNDFTFVMPCDHVFNDDEFTKCCIQSFEHLDNSIVTFGIKPSRIETGYGYIKINELNHTVKFVEKPNYEMAEKYVNEGTYFWNAGIFAFKNENMLNCFQKYASDIYENCVETLSNTNLQDDKIVSLSEIPFVNCTSISVDYAIMEKLCNDEETLINKYTIIYGSTWNDIGSYMALYEELDKNEDTNVLKGDIITINTTNCYIDNPHGLTATIGLSNLIIVNTDDALLICNNNNCQDVKKVVEKLKHVKREEAILHKTVFRPWGYYKNIEGNDTSGFKIKRISVYPNKRLSLQSHNNRSEHWVIVTGNAKVTLNEDTLLLNKDQHVYIPIKALHRIENIGNDLLEFTETQIGEYLGEDDIIRYEDDFGRK